MLIRRYFVLPPGICPFGLAHVDSPKGDLDASGGALTGPSVTVVQNSDIYPYGTTEQFPAAEDSRGNGKHFES